MSFEKEVKNTIEQHIKENWVDLNVTPVQFENVKFDPPEYSRYIQVYIVPLLTTPATLGVAGGRGSVNHLYELQCNVIIPADKGLNQGLDLARDFMNLFEFAVLNTTNGCFIDFSTTGQTRASYVDNNGKTIIPISLGFYVHRHI
jgi:hypothetical protein